MAGLRGVCTLCENRKLSRRRRRRLGNDTHLFFFRSNSTALKLLWLSCQIDPLRGDFSKSLIGSSGASEPLSSIVCGHACPFPPPCIVTPSCPYYLVSHCPDVAGSSWCPYHRTCSANWSLIQMRSSLLKWRLCIVNIRKQTHWMSQICPYSCSSINLSFSHPWFIFISESWWRLYIEYVNTLWYSFLDILHLIWRTSLSLSCQVWCIT